MHHYRSPSLRAKRGNPEIGTGLLRRYAPRNDGVGVVKWMMLILIQVSGLESSQTRAAAAAL